MRGYALRVLKGFLSKGQKASPRSGDHTCLNRQWETYETDILYDVYALQGETCSAFSTILIDNVKDVKYYLLLYVRYGSPVGQSIHHGSVSRQWSDCTCTRYPTMTAHDCIPSV